MYEGYNWIRGISISKLTSSLRGWALRNLTSAFGEKSRANQSFLKGDFCVGEIGLESAGLSVRIPRLHLVSRRGSGRSGSRERGDGIYSTEGRRWAV